MLAHGFLVLSQSVASPNGTRGFVISGVFSVYTLFFMVVLTQSYTHKYPVREGDGKEARPNGPLRDPIAQGDWVRLAHLITSYE